MLHCVNTAIAAHAVRSATLLVARVYLLSKTFADPVLIAIAAG